MWNVLKQSVIAAVIVILTDNAIGINAYVCKVQRERDHHKHWKWVLSHSNPCECTSIVFGGTSRVTTMHRFTPIYVDRPLLTDDIELIRRHYGLSCTRNVDNSITDSLSVSRLDGSKGVWSQWSDWTCNRQCGTGLWVRSRTCESTMACFGENKQTGGSCIIRDWCRSDGRCGSDLIHPYNDFLAENGKPARCLTGGCFWGWCKQ